MRQGSAGRSAARSVASIASNAAGLANMDSMVMDEDASSSDAASLGSGSDDESTCNILDACAMGGCPRRAVHVHARGGRQLQITAATHSEHQGAATNFSMNSSEATIVAYITAERITQAGATRLLQIVKDPAFCALDVRSSSWNNWMARLYTMSAHGLHTANLAVPVHDGEQCVKFVHRSAWDVLKEFVHNPEFADQMIWGFQPEYDTAGERVYGEIMSARWIESVYADLADPDATVVPICLGSDAFKPVQTRKDGHPFYMTVGNLPSAERARRRAWILMGFMPKLLHRDMKTSSDFNYRRRNRQIFQGCILHIFRECSDIWNEGGRLLRDPNGVWRKVLPVLCMYNTDRQEHEMVCMSHVHTCFHCSCPPHFDGEPDEIAGLTLFDVQHKRDAVMRAALTGVYGEEDEWRRHLKDPKPIVEVRDGIVQVICETRYAHASAVLHVHPEYNLLWDITKNIYQQCRDDPLHHMALGMMPKIMEAIVSKICASLHPPWALEDDVAPGPAGMLRIWARLGARLKTADPKQRNYTTDAWHRAFGDRQKPGAYQMKWGLTGQEHEHQFELLPFCLPGLVRVELRALTALTPPGSTAVEDPCNDCLLAVGSLLDYRSHFMRPYHSERSLQRLHEQALALLKLLRRIFPSRDCRMPVFGQEHTQRQPSWGVWTFPKAHAFWHLAAALRLFGRCVSLALRRVVGAWPCSVCVSVV